MRQQVIVQCVQSSDWNLFPPPLQCVCLGTWWGLQLPIVITVLLSVVSICTWTNVWLVHPSPLPSLLIPHTHTHPYTHYPLCPSSINSLLFDSLTLFLSPSAFILTLSRPSILSSILPSLLLSLGDTDDQNPRRSNSMSSLSDPDCYMNALWPRVPSTNQVRIIYIDYLEFSTSANEPAGPLEGCYALLSLCVFQ